MAKLSAHGEEITRFERDGRVRYRVMSDAVVLRQFKFDNRWETPTIALKAKSVDAAKGWAQRMTQ